MGGLLYVISYRANSRHADFLVLVTRAGGEVTSLSRGNELARPSRHIEMVLRARQARGKLYRVGILYICPKTRNDTTRCARYGINQSDWNVYVKRRVTVGSCRRHRNADFSDNNCAHNRTSSSTMVRLQSNSWWQEVCRRCLPSLSSASDASRKYLMAAYS